MVKCLQYLIKNNGYSFTEVKIMNKMFEDVGKKIKSLAKVMFIICEAASVIGAIAMWSTEEAFIYGLLILIVGSLSAIISAWFLYGFGEIIDSLCSIQDMLYLTKNKYEEQSEINEENLKLIV